MLASLGLGQASPVTASCRLSSSILQNASQAKHSVPRLLRITLSMLCVLISFLLPGSRHCSHSSPASSQSLSFAGWLCTCCSKLKGAVFITVEGQQGQVPKGQGAYHAEHAVAAPVQEALHLVLVAVGLVRGQDAVCAPLPAPTL